MNSFWRIILLSIETYYLLAIINEFITTFNLFLMLFLLIFQNDKEVLEIVI